MEIIKKLVEPYSETPKPQESTPEELAAKENIVVEFVVYNPRNEQVYPFPSTVDEHYSMSSCELRIKASTAVAE